MFVCLFVLLPLPQIAHLNGPVALPAGDATGDGGGGRRGDAFLGPASEAALGGAAAGADDEVEAGVGAVVASTGAAFCGGG